ncbi:hypothetical protein ACLPHD_06455 [Serratia odorifera]|uniref:hypothetical protein n=1 Tax=Serratia odorifera TaxID=618 RepID=UPI003D26CC23
MDKLHEESRKQFEGWALQMYSGGNMFLRVGPHKEAYHQTIIQELWEAWQTSRASIVVEPTYFVLKLDESNEWGYAEDLTIYETELDASKAKDDFGGEIIPVIDLRSIGLSIKGE